MNEKVAYYGIEISPDRSLAIGYSVDPEGVVTTLRDHIGDVETIKSQVENLANESGIIFEGEATHRLS